MILEFRNFGLAIAGQALFTGLNARLENAQTLAVLGCNGVGKSSFLKAIAGVIPHDKNAIYSDIIALSYLPQTIEIRREVPILVSEYLELAKIINPTIGRDEIKASLARFEIEDLANKPMGGISGGQLILVNLARIDLEGRELILLDEPFASLDAKKAEILLKAINEWKSQRKMVIVTIHDENIAKGFDHFLTLSDGIPLWENKNPHHSHNCQFAHRDQISDNLVHTNAA